MDLTIFNYTFHNVQLTSFSWDAIYDFFGIKEFIYFISSPSIQDTLFPVKIVFIFFTVIFFCVLMWLYVNSSYIQYQFFQDTAEFFSREKYGLGKINKSWKKIRKRTESGTESDLKLAVIEADDFLYQHFQDMGYEGATFEELVEAASKKNLPDAQELLDAHAVRNAIVYQPDFNVEAERAKEIISLYENASKHIAAA